MNVKHILADSCFATRIKFFQTLHNLYLQEHFDFDFEFVYVKKFIEIAFRNLQNANLYFVVSCLIKSCAK